MRRDTQRSTLGRNATLRLILEPIQNIGAIKPRLHGRVNLTDKCHFAKQVRV